MLLLSLVLMVEHFTMNHEVGTNTAIVWGNNQCFWT